MSVKAPRGLTHANRLYAPEAWVDRIAAGMHALGGCRGVVLVQLAPGQERRIREWEGAGQDVYVYFNNDAEGNAVRNARRLRELLCHGTG